MVACRQKYCANCVKPVFDEDNKFLFGQCKKSRLLILYSDAEAAKNMNVQPLYCYKFELRKKKLHY